MFEALHCKKYKANSQKKKAHRYQRFKYPAKLDVLLRYVW